VLHLGATLPFKSGIPIRMMTPGFSTPYIATTVPRSVVSSRANCYLPESEGFKSAPCITMLLILCLLPLNCRSKISGSNKTRKVYYFSRALVLWPGLDRCNKCRSATSCCTGCNTRLVKFLLLSPKPRGECTLFPRFFHPHAKSPTSCFFVFSMIAENSISPIYRCRPPQKRHVPNPGTLLAVCHMYTSTNLEHRP